MAALDLNDISTGALTKSASIVMHHSAEVTATVEAAGYYNSLAVDSKVGPVGLLFHFDTAGKITIYGYTHDGTTLTLNTVNALIPIP